MVYGAKYPANAIGIWKERERERERERYDPNIQQMQ